MRMLAFLLTFGVAACGGDSSPSRSPTAPTAAAPAPAPAPAPTPPPIPAATLQSSGQGGFRDCLSLVQSCDFEASIQNVGAGCATQTTVVARFFDGNNTQVGSDAQMGAVGASLASRTIRPQEIVAIASINRVAQSTATTSRSYRLFPTWTNVRCP